MTGEDDATETASKPWASGLEALYEEHYQPLVRLAHFLNGSNAFAEDVVQEAFVGLNRRWDTVDNASAYLRTTVVNACRSDARRGRLLRLHPLGPSIVRHEPDEMADALGKLAYRQRAATAEVSDGTPSNLNSRRSAISSTAKGASVPQPDLCGTAGILCWQ